MLLDCEPASLSSTPVDHGARRGVCVVARGLTVARGAATVLRDVDLRIEPGELVAIIGASGAGKSTLLDALAGLRPPTSGTVHLDGVASTDHVARRLVGYVPQDDIIHRELPVRSTLRYAARLRLPAGTSTADVERAVAAVLDQLDLTGRADAPVAQLSGGQRKRTSIAVELLPGPPVLFLDEPTSGLDPVTAASLMGTLRTLADAGTTIVLTTHAGDDLPVCDRVLRVADGGVSADRAAATAGEPRPATVRPPAPPARPAATATQWRVLAARNLELLRSNRLTLAIMLGAPALVIAMFTMLFRAGALDADAPDATSAISTTYWLAFAAFFFGLTYGLLQVVTELPILRREVFVGLRIGPYLGAKVVVLAPVLVLVNLAMLGVLRLLDRLPALDAGTYGRMAATLLLTAIAALALGLLASAAVADPSQATLALPMLCFPAVLFAGAVLPVPAMSLGGRVMSVTVIARWAFEALGHELGLPSLLAGDPSGPGPTLLGEFDGAFDHGLAGHWTILAGFAALFLVAAAGVLRRRTRPAAG